MKITVVSRSWPSSEHSGVSLIAASHVRILVEEGHSVSIIGANLAVLNENLPVCEKLHIEAYGAGAIYSPIRIKKQLIREALESFDPSLLVVEAWQTALTEASIDVAHDMGIPILMISHGVSVYPYSNRLKDISRAMAWCIYRSRLLPKRISHLTAITTLDNSTTSNRFYDRDIARSFGIPIIPLINAPVNWCDSGKNFNERNREVLVIGYFSSVKNQLGAIDVIANLPKNLKFRFIGQRKGSYYIKCVKRVNALGLENQVTFCQDDECDLANTIASSLIVLCTSITEALPVTLLEAMASGTPFVATPVGAIPTLEGGIIASDVNSQKEAILALANDVTYWTRLSEHGKQAFRSHYTNEHVRKSLLLAVKTATSHNKLIHL